MRASKEEIEKYLSEIRSHIDYEVGDWVETCNMLPGIVQKIECYYDDRPNMQCITEGVEVFYPHYALETPGKYFGGSCCSITHCGVHKITPEYAMKLLSIGKERLTELWENSKDRKWEDVVEEEFQKLQNDYRRRFMQSTNTILC